MQIIPAVDLLGNDAVRLEQGDFCRVLFRQPIEGFMARIVATSPPMIHIVDLEGARDGVLRSDVIARCVDAAGEIPVQVSGGIRSIEDATAVLRAGASRVIVGTAAWHDVEAMSQFVDELSDRLIVALDVKGGRIAVRGWTESSGLDVDEALEQCERAGVTRLHVTAVERDGTMRGPDLSLYRQVCQSALAVVAAGGVRNDDDIAALADIGCEAAVMGLGYLGRLGISLDS
ncbi:MAG: HisA/HisF-related TIM barrel protein [Acidimicrobiales bacterium]